MKTTKAIRLLAIQYVKHEINYDIVKEREGESTMVGWMVQPRTEHSANDTHPRSPAQALRNHVSVKLKWWRFGIINYLSTFFLAGNTKI